MISFAIILALSVFAISALAAYWKDIVKWLKTAYTKIKQALKRAPEGVRTFVAKVGGVFQSVSRNFLKNETTREWEVVECTKPVSENQIPPEIREKARALTNGQEVQTTQALKLALSK